MYADHLPRTAFETLDEEIAELTEARVRCRKAVLLSRAAIVAGGLTVVLSLPFVVLRSPMVVVAAVTAMIGGTVWGGASKMSGEELDTRLADAEARKVLLFDEIAARNGWHDTTPTVH